MNLSIVCVTNGEPHALEFAKHFRDMADKLGAELVLGLDGAKAQASELRTLADVTVNVNGTGILESVLDEVLERASGKYILRLDDDEKVSPALFTWLRGSKYLSGNHFAFPRPYLWGDTAHMLADLYPDLQTRLSVKAKAGGRDAIHCGSPYGTGVIVPFAIEHHKFLVKSFDERKQIADRYEQERTGAGWSAEYGRYNLPEMFVRNMQIVAYSDGNYQKC